MKILLVDGTACGCPLGTRNSGLPGWSRQNEFPITRTGIGIIGNLAFAGNFSGPKSQLHTDNR